MAKQDSIMVWHTLTMQMALRCLLKGLVVLVLTTQVQAQTQGTEEEKLPAEGALDFYGPVSAGDTSGVTKDKVQFGQSAALTGSSGSLGHETRIGIKAAFEEVNKTGGIQGRKLQIITLDDGYEPEQAIKNTHWLISNQRVFALMGAVGTSTVKASIPIAAEANVPFIGPVTGNASLRNAHWSNMVHMRASYEEEVETMIERLISDLNITRIAVMYQNDYFGRDAYESIQLSLSRHQLKPAASGVYERNTGAIKSALLDISRSNPEAVIIVGTTVATANFIRWSRLTGLNPVFMNLSFVGSKALAELLGPDGAGVFVTQVVPFPAASDLPVSTTYLRALKAIAPKAEPSFFSFEGYLIGRLAIESLRHVGLELTREKFLAFFKEKRVVDLGGFKLYYGRSIDQGSDSVFITAINNTGYYQPIQKLTDIIGVRN